MKLFPITKTFDGVTVLDFPGLELVPGKIYAVIGANGSGKSTFARVLAGILRPDRKGACHSALSVGYMPQKNYAFRMCTKKNLLLGARDMSQAEKRMSAMQISHLAEKPAHRLSGGETARMALARLMMKKFDLVILDEPTASMDMEGTILAESAIKEYVQETNCALILVTHSLQQARRISDEILFFHSGKLVEFGSKDTILHNPSDNRTKRFLDFYGT